jgi:hypothetical protein
MYGYVLRVYIHTHTYMGRRCRLLYAGLSLRCVLDCPMREYMCVCMSLAYYVWNMCVCMSLAYYVWIRAESMHTHAHIHWS